MRVVPSNRAGKGSFGVERPLSGMRQLPADLVAKLLDLRPFFLYLPRVPCRTFSPSRDRLRVPGGG